jgi:hypothetical protein
VTDRITVSFCCCNSLKMENYKPRDLAWLLSLNGSIQKEKDSKTCLIDSFYI